MLVYLLKNTVNGKGYVGITTKRLCERWASHTYDARTGKGYALANAIRKYGTDAWTKEVLETCPDVETLKTREVVWIAGLGTHVSTGDGYNIGTGGESSAGVKRSPETRARISASKVGRPQSEESRRKRSEATRGRVFSDEHKAKISAAKMGHKVSAETRAKMSETRKRKNKEKANG